MLHAIHTILHVATTDAAEIDDLLSSTVESLIPDALAINHGIRVTRIGPGEYTGGETAADVASSYTVLSCILSQPNQSSWCPQTSGPGASPADEPEGSCSG